MAANVFVLTVLGVTATLSAAMTLRAATDHSPGALVRWGILYAVSVVVPCGWSFYHLWQRRGVDATLAVAPAYVGTVALLASLSLIRGPEQGGALAPGVWTALAINVFLAVGTAARRVKGDR